MTKVERLDVGVLLNAHRDEWVGLPALMAIMDLPNQILGFEALSRDIGPRVVGPAPEHKISVEQQNFSRFDEMNPMFSFPGDPNGNSDQRFAWEATKFFTTTDPATGERLPAYDVVVDIHGNKNDYNVPFYSSKNRDHPLV